MNINTKRQLTEFLENYSKKLDRVIEQVDNNDVDKTADDIKAKINTIRGGKSLDDPAVSEQFKAYITKLTVDERKGLGAFLDGLSKVVTGAEQATQAATPDTAGVTMASGSKVRSIKPNVVRTVDAMDSTTNSAKEDTSAPVETPTPSQSKVVPIVPKKR